MALATLAVFALSTAAAGPIAAPIATLRYGDGDERTVDVYAPASTTTTAKPIAVFLHGGVWQHGDRRDFADVGAELARRGFVAFVASYRLAPHSRWPAQREDAAAAVELALREGPKYGGDPTHLVVVGHSAGAQMAALLAIDPHFDKKIAAFAFLSGVFDLRAPLDEDQADGGFYAFVAPVFGTDRATLDAASPIRAIKSKLGVPILLATGEHDYRAMRAQTEAMRAKLVALGDQVAFVDAPGVDHYALVTSPAALDAVGALLTR
jgi:acetyl esterase/lipase